MGKWFSGHVFRLLLTVHTGGQLFQPKDQKMDQGG